MLPRRPRARRAERVIAAVAVAIEQRAAGAADREAVATRIPGDAQTALARRAKEYLELVTNLSIVTADRMIFVSQRALPYFLSRLMMRMICSNTSGGTIPPYWITSVSIISHAQLHTATVG